MAPKLAGSFNYRDPDLLYSEWARHGYVARKLAKTLGVAESTIQNWVSRHDLKKPADADDLPEYVVKGGRGIVASDWHIPITDWALVDYMIGVARKHRATDWLVIPGDFLNFDALSRFDARQGDAGVSAERAAGIRALDKVRRVFDSIYLSRGNHDMRLMGKLDGNTSFIESMQMFLAADDVNISGGDAIWLDTPEGTYRCCHTRQYSRQQLAVPARLADVHREHVIAGHRHHHAVGWSWSGYRAIESGGLFDTARTKYLREWTTDFPVWQPGFLVMTEGVPYAPLLSPTPPKGGN